MEEKLFNEVFEYFQSRYPSRLTLKKTNGSTIVYIDGEGVFCTDGYTLLHNLTLLCDHLGGELL